MPAARLLVALLATALLLCPRWGHAEGAPNPDLERARALYEDGEAAYRLGRFGEASARYEEAYRLSKLTAILFDMAQAERRWFDIDRAPAHLRKAIDLYRAFLRDAREQPAMAAQVQVTEKLLPDVERALAQEEARRREALAGKVVGGEEALVIADQLLVAGDAASALVLLDRVLASPGNPREIVVGAHQRRALAAGRLGNFDTSFASFQRALAMDPAFRAPDDAPQTTRDAYVKAWGLSGSHPIALGHTPPGEARRGVAVRLVATVEHDPLGLVEELALLYRRAGEGAFLTARVPRRPAPTTLEIPAAYLGGHGGAQVQYYLSARDRNGGEVARDGSAREPFAFSIEPDPILVAVPTAAPPKRRWPIAVGVIIGVLVAGAAGATGAVLATRREEPVLPAWDLRQ